MTYKEDREGEGSNGSSTETHIFQWNVQPMGRLCTLGKLKPKSWVRWMLGFGSLTKLSSSPSPSPFDKSSLKEGTLVLFIHKLNIFFDFEQVNLAQIQTTIEEGHLCLDSLKEYINNIDHLTLGIICILLQLLLEESLRPERTFQGFEHTFHLVELFNKLFATLLSSLRLLHHDRLGRKDGRPSNMPFLSFDQQATSQLVGLSNHFSIPHNFFSFACRAFLSSPSIGAILFTNKKNNHQVK